MRYISVSLILLCLANCRTHSTSAIQDEFTDEERLLIDQIKMCAEGSRLNEPCIRFEGFQINLSDNDLPFREHFSLRNGLSSALISHLAYLQEDQLVHWAREWGFTSVISLAERGTQAYFLPTPSFNIIVFKGTEPEIDDYLVDADLRIPAFGGVRIHAGFNRAFERVWPQLRRQFELHGRMYISNGDSSTKPTWIMGHSMGGGIALATAARLFEALHTPDALDERLRNNIKIAGVYTFGGPRVFKDLNDHEMLRAFLSEVRVRRFVFRNDWVADLPFDLTWQHVGKLVHLDSRCMPEYNRVEEGGTGSQPAKRELKEILKAFFAPILPEEFALRRPLENPDHAMYNHVRCLWHHIQSAAQP